MVVEELPEPVLEVDAVLQLPEAVPLPGIGQPDDGFSEEPEGVVPLEPLLPIHRRVVLSMKVEDGRVHILDPGDGRLIPIEVEIVVGIGSVTPLPVDVVLVVALAAAHEELVELAHQVDGCGPVGHCGEHLRAGGDVGPSPAAVGMPAEPRCRRVGITKLHDLPHGGLNALQHIGVGAPHPEVDVGLHDQIAVAHVAGEVGGVPVAGSRMEVEVLGILLVEPDQHGELLPLLVTVRDGQRPLEPDSVVVRVVEEDPASPEVFVLLGIGRGDPHPVGEVLPAHP